MNEKIGEITINREHKFLSITYTIDGVDYGLEQSYLEDKFIVLELAMLLRQIAHQVQSLYK